MKMYVGNLSFETTERDLKTLFSEHGGVTDVHMPVDRESGQPRGFAFVTMDSKDAMVAAMAALDGKVSGSGKSIEVLSTSKDEVGYQSGSIFSGQSKGEAKDKGESKGETKNKLFRTTSENSAEWTDAKNQRRCVLVDKEIDGALTQLEKTELEELQSEMIVYRREVAPLPLEDLRELHQELLEQCRKKTNPLE